MPNEKIICDKEELVAIANAIRSKTGKTNSIMVSNMPAEIYDISVGTGGSESIDDTIITYNSENETVKTFIAAAREQYPNDPTLTIVANHRDGVTAYDAPLAYTITGLSSGKIYFVDETNGRTWFDTVSGSTYDITNLIPNHVYRWVNIDSSGTRATGRLKDTASLRLMSGVSTGSKNLRNFRDLGGWPCDGGTMKYGLVLRGARAHSDTEHLNDTEKQKLWDFDRVYSELDMRDADDMVGVDAFSHINPGVKYDNQPISGAYLSYFGLTSSHISESKAIVETIMQNTANGLPTYIHCSGGADRTGTVSSILEGVCGVSYTDIDIDYELTSMTPWSTHIRVRYGTDSTVAPDKYGVYWNEWITYIKGLSGINPWVTWCVNSGISIDLINAFRNAIIDGNPPQIDIGGGEVDPPEFTDNILTSAVDSDGSLYNGGTGYKAGYRIDSSGLESSTTADGICITGFIPCSLGNTFSFEGMLLAANNTFEGYSSSYYRVAVYDSSFNMIYVGSEYSALTHSNNNAVIDGDGVTQFTLNKLSSSTSIDNTAYIRFAFKLTGTPAIYIS